MTQLNKFYKLAISCFIFLLYLGIMSISKTSTSPYYQVRIATSLYALAYTFPFLILPLSFANLTSNLLICPWGFPDVIGGFFVGLLTTLLIVFFKKKQFNYLFSAIPMVLIPALGVSIWMAPIMKVSYCSLVTTIGIGQIVPATIGMLILGILETYIEKYILSSKRYD